MKIAMLNHSHICLTLNCKTSFAEQGAIALTQQAIGVFPYFLIPD
jgi:hypothetical protein